MKAKLKPLKLTIVGIILMALIAAIFKQIYGIRLNSKIRTLIEVNQSMMHYQGMNYDLTGLGPLIILSTEKTGEFEVSYLRIVSGKNVFERSINTGATTPLNKLTSKISEGSFDISVTARLTNLTFAWILAYTLLTAAFFSFIFLLLKFLTERQRTRELSDHAKQVAHDIRSPLEVLKAFQGDIENLPEETKRLLKMSIGRIEEISFSLLKSSTVNKTNELGNIEPHSLVMIIEEIVLEKTVEYSKNDSLVIKAICNSESYEAYSKVSKGVLKRVLSNLINNAAEAISGKDGQINVYLSKQDLFNVIKISDNGKGISEKIKNEIFTKGFTTKDSGNGLGLSNALREVRSFDGTIEIESKEGLGTTIVIMLPNCDPPSNLLTSIELCNYDKIILLDDDSSFHELWKKVLNINSSLIESFYSPDALFVTYKKLPKRCLLLTDLDLKHDIYDGIKVIQTLDCRANSVLVTSQILDKALQARCIEDNIKIVTKSFIGHLKINRLPSEIILVDDDLLIRLDWTNYFKNKPTRFKCFPSINELLKEIYFIEKNAVIYLDSNLGDGIRGEIEAKKLSNLGFDNLFLATGFSEDGVNKSKYIKGIHSKDPRKIFE